MAPRPKIQGPIDQIIKEHGVAALNDDDTSLNLLGLPAETHYRLATVSEVTAEYDGNSRPYLRGKFDESDDSNVTNGSGGDQIFRDNHSSNRRILDARKIKVDYHRPLFEPDDLVVRIGRTQVGGSSLYTHCTKDGMGTDGALEIKQLISALNAPRTDYLGVESVLTKHASNIGNGKYSIFFVAQHTIRFPERLIGREAVDFSGLPRGTMMFCKNGGVLGVHSTYSGTSPKLIRLEAMNEKGMEALENWGAPEKGKYERLNPENKDTLVRAVNANLVHPSERYRIKTDSIRLPFAQPWQRMIDVRCHANAYPIFEFTPTQEDETVGFCGVRLKRRGDVYYATKEAFEEAFEDFFFGT